MFAVIFKAKINKLDKSYYKMAKQMRELAINKYGCIEFVSVTQDTDEIAISYWQSQEDIQRFKQDAQHLAAQESGRSIWYKSYQVQVAEVIREYKSP